MRSLTARETEVLAHVVVDPAAWWAHACSRDGSDGKRPIDAEAALAAKIKRWESEYDAAKAAEGGAYKTRFEKEADALANAPAPVPRVDPVAELEATVADLESRLAALETPA